MYFYTLSEGQYSDYCFEMIYHKRKFSKKEFIEMYNQALGDLGGEYFFGDGLGEKMCELFGFEKVDSEWEINAGYGRHKHINPDEYNDNSHMIDVY